MTIIPHYLKPGDTIGIVCPAGYMPFEKMQTCIETLINWGFKVIPGKTLGHQFHYFSGTDEERLADLAAHDGQQAHQSHFVRKGWIRNGKNH